MRSALVSIRMLFHHTSMNRHDSFSKQHIVYCFIECSTSSSNEQINVNNLDRTQTYEQERHSASFNHVDLSTTLTSAPLLSSSATINGHLTSSTQHPMMTSGANQLTSTGNPVTSSHTSERSKQALEVS
jgi:hypothetical protein